MCVEHVLKHIRNATVRAHLNKQRHLILSALPKNWCTRQIVPTVLAHCTDALHRPEHIIRMSQTDGKNTPLHFMCLKLASCKNEEIWGVSADDTATYLNGRY